MSTDATAAPRTLAPQISAAAPWPLAPQRGRGQDAPVLAVSMAPQLSTAVPRVLAEHLSQRQRPWRRSAAVPWRPPTQGRTWPPPPLCGAKGHGAAKLICGTRVHGTVAWARPLPRWRRGGLGATLAAQGTGRHAGRLCGATNDGAAKLCCGAMARAAAERARF